MRLRIFIAFASSLCLLSAIATAQQLPHYRVDPWWPQELPHNWIIGQVTGLAVDREDHIWVLHDPNRVPKDDAGAAQSPPWTHCCVPAPAVLEFDAAGKALRAWGGSGRIPAWPVAPHGITVDKKGNVWIGGVGSPWNPDLPQPLGSSTTPSHDRQVLKFSPDGKLLLQIGQPSTVPANNQDVTLLGSPTGIAVDDAAHEVYIADGFLNKRIVVFDSDTGAFKRGWGAYGIALSAIGNADPSASELPTGRPRDASVAPPKDFANLAGIALSEDGLVYAADTKNNRIQVFTRQGKFVKEFFVAPNTLGPGSVWSVTLSRDPAQKYLLVADGASGVLRILDRDSGHELEEIGSKGRNAGQFENLGWVAVDSQQVLYTGEVHFNRSWDGWQATHTGKTDSPGGRLQRFVLQKQ
jgi:hypothetical protein